MTANQEILGLCIKVAMEKLNWNYRSGSAGDHYQAEVCIDNKGNYPVSIYVCEDCYIISAFLLPVEVIIHKKYYSTVLNQLNRINNNLFYGRFVLIPETGSICFQFSVDCGEECQFIPNQLMIERSLYRVIEILEKYSDALMEMSQGKEYYEWRWEVKK